MARHLHWEIGHGRVKKLSAGPEPHGGSRTEQGKRPEAASLRRLDSE